VAESLQSQARQALEGRTKVRCTAMEARAGTPEAPHTGHECLQERMAVPKASAAKKIEKA